MGLVAVEDSQELEGNLVENVGRTFQISPFSLGKIPKQSFFGRQFEQISDFQKYTSFRLARRQHLNFFKRPLNAH